MDYNLITNLDFREKFLDRPYYFFDKIEKNEYNIALAVMLVPRLLTRISKSEQTYEICLEAVKKDGELLRVVSSKLITEELCMSAVQQNGEAIRYVPDKIINKKIVELAVKQNGEALYYIEYNYINKDLCNKAVKSNGLSLVYVPKKYVDDKLIHTAVKQNGLALEYVPYNKKKKELISIAFESDVMSLPFIPNKFINDDLIQKAIDKNWKVYEHLPESYYTLPRIKSLLKTLVKEEDVNTYVLNKVLLKANIEINDDLEVITNLRKLGVRKVKCKYYDSNTKKFLVFEITPTDPEGVEKEFDLFSEFYDYLGGDLNDADLLNYNFDNVNLKMYNIEGAVISSNILIKNGLYNSEFANNVIGKDRSLYFSETNKEEDVPNYIMNLSEDIIFKTKNNIKFFYITDIHLDHKLNKKYPDVISQEELNYFIKSIVNRITDVNKDFDSYLLIGGDVSSNLEISKLFYRELTQKWSGRRIIVTLGNHELWDIQASTGKYSDNTLEEVVEKYRLMLEELEIKFVFNALCILNRESFEILEENEIFNMKEEELQSRVTKSYVSVLGSVGFSGYNDKYNASSLLYRNKITTLEEDLEYTKKFEKLYTKVKNVLKDTEVIVFTHMPKENWSLDEWCSNWFYVSGHTHRNSLYNNETKKVFSDNQIGYYNNSCGLKSFMINETTNIFKFFDSGIYEITREEYLEFNQRLNINVQFNQKGIIKMLKNNGMYMFVLEQSYKKYLLSGGQKKNLENEIKYYYEKLGLYSEYIKKSLNNYSLMQDKISREIMKIGGTGTIHGCIIDIDFLNHVYLNPYDGKLTFYYAESMENKYVFENIGELLKCNRNDLYLNYCKMINSSENKFELVTAHNNKPAKAKYVGDTTMYRESNIIKSLQYITESNVIRIWNDDIIKKISTINGNAELKLIMMD